MIDMVVKKLNEIMAARGKKTNRKEQIELHNKLGSEHSLGTGVHFKVKFVVIAALFEYNAKLSDAMKPDSWEKCMQGVVDLLAMLEEFGEAVTTGELILEEQEQLDEASFKVRLDPGDLPAGDAPLRAEGLGDVKSLNPFSSTSC